MQTTWEEIFKIQVHLNNLPTLSKVPMRGLMTMEFNVLDWPANSSDTRPNKADELKAAIEENWASFV